MSRCHKTRPLCGRAFPESFVSPLVLRPRDDHQTLKTYNRMTLTFSLFVFSPLGSYLLYTSPRAITSLSPPIPCVIETESTQGSIANEVINNCHCGGTIGKGFGVGGELLQLLDRFWQLSGLKNLSNNSRIIYQPHLRGVCAVMVRERRGLLAL